MNDDDRLSRYLVDQAGAITLPPGDPGAAARRGERRRTRRRAAIAGVATVAVAASSFTVIDRGEPDTQVDSSSFAAAVVATPFDWTVVAPEVGLGYSRSTAIVDGAVYSLSTEPGPYDDDGSYEASLYRSDDGADWAEVSLPAGVRPSSLGSAGDTLYAIGTAPAGGGGRDLVVSASTDGAASWSTVALPADVAALEARHPGQIVISQPAVAATDATHLVATVVVSANPDVRALLPEVADPNAGWEITPEGVTVYELAPCEETGSPECIGPPITIVDGDAGEVRRAEGVVPTQPEVGGTYTWDELGLDPELRSLIGGRTYVYASDDGATFEPATLPAGAGGWAGHLVATDDGYRLYLGQANGSSATTQILRSADGHTWTTSAMLPGSPHTAGLLGEHPAVGLWGEEGGLLVHVEQVDGSYAVLDLLSAVDGADGSSGIGDVAFGPLGMAALVWANDSPVSTIVHSVDGTSLSSVDLGDHLGGPGIAIGISVSADAVLVRVDEPSDGDPTTVPTQQVLVGTPR